MKSEWGGETWVLDNFNRGWAPQRTCEQLADQREAESEANGKLTRMGKVSIKRIRCLVCVYLMFCLRLKRLLEIFAF